MHSRIRFPLQAKEEARGGGEFFRDRIEYRAGTPCPYDPDHLFPTVILSEAKDLSGEILRLRLRMTEKLHDPSPYGHGVPCPPNCMPVPRFRFYFSFAIPKPCASCRFPFSATTTATSPSASRPDRPRSSIPPRPTRSPSGSRRKRSTPKRSSTRTITATIPAATRG